MIELLASRDEGHTCACRCLVTLATYAAPRSSDESEDRNEIRRNTHISPIGGWVHIRSNFSQLDKTFVPFQVFGRLCVNPMLS